MTIKKLFILLSFFIIMISGIFAEESIENIPQNNFAKGADVSWLPQMEASGFMFYDESGEETDCLEILKEHGLDSVRLRTWVDPSEDPINGHCDIVETVDMALRAKEMGFRVMIDFHYSDSWSDPSKQKKPKAWKNHNFEDLKKDVYDYTYELMNELKKAGVVPEWVQIGNEINPGMLLPSGSSENMSNLSQLINEGYRAVKDVSRDSLVVIHLANGIDNELYRWYFDGLAKYNTNYDVIGMSYYPYWDKIEYKESIDKLVYNMNDMVKRYNKYVMLVETGNIDTDVEETQNMLADLIKRVKKIDNNMGLGVFYWEPEGARVWSGYNLSCWQENGLPTKALDAFLENRGTETKSDYKIVKKSYSKGDIHIDYPEILLDDSLKDSEKINKFIKEDVLERASHYDEEFVIVDIGYQIGWQSKNLISIRYGGTLEVKDFGRTGIEFYSTNIMLNELKKIRLSDFINVDDRFLKEMEKSIKIGNIDSVDNEIVSEYIKTNHLLESLKNDYIKDPKSIDYYSFFTKENLIVRLYVPRVIGGYVDIKLNYSDIKECIKKENSIWNDFYN